MMMMMMMCLEWTVEIFWLNESKLGEWKDVVCLSGTSTRQKKQVKRGSFIVNLISCNIMEYDNQNKDGDAEGMAQGHVSCFWVHFHTPERESVCVCVLVSEWVSEAKSNKGTSKTQSDSEWLQRCRSKSGVAQYSNTQTHKQHKIWHSRDKETKR